MSRLKWDELSKYEKIGLVLNYIVGVVLLLTAIQKKRIGPNYKWGCEDPKYVIGFFGVLSVLVLVGTTAFIVE
jgi:hypothetical protein